MDSFTGDVKERYYGRIEEISKLDYSGERVPMFHVRWAKSVRKEDRYFTTMSITEAKSVDAPDQGVPAPAALPAPRRRKMKDFHGRGPAMLSGKRRSSPTEGEN
jgi:hypothetical protein